MITKIRNDEQYDQIMQLIESFIQKAGANGGFHTLKKAEAEEFKQLSILAEHYEDNVLKLMPIPVTITDAVEQKIKEMKLN